MAQIALIPLLVLSVGLLLRAEARAQQKRIYTYKPLSTVLVILIAGLSLRLPAARPGYTAGILVGLVLSLGGDGALMFSSPRAFRTGLILFALAHVAYSVTLTSFGGFHWADWISAAVLLALTMAVYAYLAPGLGEMRGPVIVYMLLISLMVHRAVSTFWGDATSLAQAWMLSVGAALFWISDLILAIARFRGPLRHQRLSLAAYYAGQLLIALSTSFFAPAVPFL
ncbi:MAG TPA: lysoplasmalogenase [Anaerolineae bacterium]|nr:lysoplasmalogenase [Anaerolineae bacterium]